MRESGMVFDKLVLTTDPSYVPTGAGPAESVPTVATPVISPGGGTYTDAVTVTLTTATPGAEIYYTLDGTTPGGNSTVYSDPFTLEESAVVKATAFLDGYQNSVVTSADFVFGSQQGQDLLPTGQRIAEDRVDRGGALSRQHVGIRRSRVAAEIRQPLFGR